MANPVFTARNEDDGVAAHVHVNTTCPGTFNVTIQDIETGLYLDTAFIRLPLERAKTLAQNIVDGKETR